MTTVLLHIRAQHRPSSRGLNRGWFCNTHLSKEPISLWQVWGHSQSPLVAVSPSCGSSFLSPATEVPLAPLTSPPCLPGWEVLLLLGLTHVWQGDKAFFSPASLFSQRWKSSTRTWGRSSARGSRANLLLHSRHGATSLGKPKLSTYRRKTWENLAWSHWKIETHALKCLSWSTVAEPDYILICKGPRTLFPWLKDISWLLSFSWALLPAETTNNHFSWSATVLYSIALQPSPKHQSHAIYRKLENSLNLAYFKSNRGSSSPHEDSPASFPPPLAQQGEERWHPCLLPGLRAATAACSRKEIGGW